MNEEGTESGFSSMRVIVYNREGNLMLQLLKINILFECHY
jgi:hypothetical protein